MNLNEPLYTLQKDCDVKRIENLQNGENGTM